MENDDDEHLMESSHAGNSFRYGQKRETHMYGDLADQRYSYSSEKHGYFTEDMHVDQ